MDFYCFDYSTDMLLKIQNNERPFLGKTLVKTKNLCCVKPCQTGQWQVKGWELKRKQHMSQHFRIRMVMNLSHLMDQVSLCMLPWWQE